MALFKKKHSQVWPAPEAEQVDVLLTYIREAGMASAVRIGQVIDDSGGFTVV